MVKVRIDDGLIKKLERKFGRADLKSIHKMFLSLEDNPLQGDMLKAFGAIVLKEIRYKSFRFYFLHSKDLLIIKDPARLRDEIIRFIDMSKKNDQQRVIYGLKDMLKRIDRTDDMLKD